MSKKLKKGTSIESLTVKALKEFGYSKAEDDCYLQSFELSSFK